MTEYEIRSKIKYNEKLAESYQNQIREFEEQISNLECLKNKLLTLQNNFGEKQDMRKKSLTGISGKTALIKIAAQYYSGMSELLGGAEFLNAYNGLSDAKDTVRWEQDKLYTQIDDLSAALREKEQSIEYWRTKLRNLEYK